MKITAVELTLIEQPPVEPSFVWRHGLPGSEGRHIGGWLALRTDEGITGYAYTHRGLITQDILDRRIRPELLGADPLHREWLWHRMWELDRIEEFPLYIQGIIDTALWDLAGKIAAQPVHELLGTYREEIPAYASTTTFGSIEEYLDIADQCIELGYSAIKLHAWGNARRDAELSVALRAHVGDDIALMYDGSAAFDLADATYLGRALADAEYEWYEEPMREFNIWSYQQLSERTAVPLLVAETSDGAHMNTADFIVSGAATAVRTSAGYKAGLTGAMRIAHLADSFQMRAEVHGGGLAARHLCMAIPNTTYYESLVFTNPVRRPLEVDDRGMVRATSEPGIGYASEWGSDVPPLPTEAVILVD